MKSSQIRWASRQDGGAQVIPWEIDENPFKNQKPTIGEIGLRTVFV